MAKSTSNKRRLEQQVGSGSSGGESSTKVNFDKLAKAAMSREMLAAGLTAAAAAIAASPKARRAIRDAGMDAADSASNAASNMVSNASQARLADRRGGRRRRPARDVGQVDRQRFECSSFGQRLVGERSPPRKSARDQGRASDDARKTGTRKTASRTRPRRQARRRPPASRAAKAHARPARPDQAPLERRRAQASGQARNAHHLSGHNRSQGPGASRGPSAME